MHPTHEPWLVALSLFVAFQGSYVGLHLARQVDAAEGLRRRFLIAAAALTQALGIWTMHFVGMLAFRLPFAVDFLVLPTLLSFLGCVLVVGLAVFAASTAQTSPTRIALAGVFMGAGIVTMHYIGMYALHASLDMVHTPRWVAASVAGSMAASTVALWLGFGVDAGFPGSRFSGFASGAGLKGAVLLPAALMGLAISAMHYSAMAGLTFHPRAENVAAGMPAFSPGLLAIVVSVVAFLVSGLFLLTLIPEHRTGIESLSLSAAALQAADTAGTAGLLSAPPPAAPARTLPVERDGLRRRFDVAHLVAVQAQAHYSQLFDGETLWFCPLSISEVEAALDPSVFARIHRSHLVNLDRVSSLKGTADTAVVTMTARTPYRAPVSRTRRHGLKQRLAERLHPAD